MTSIDWDGALPKSGMEELLSEQSRLLYSYYKCLCECGFDRVDALRIIIAWQESYWGALLSKILGSKGRDLPE